MTAGHADERSSPAAQSAHAELSQLLLATTADFLAAREPAGHLATGRGEHGAASRGKASRLGESGCRDGECADAGGAPAALEPEALVLVLRFHDVHALCRCARVSRAWRRAAGDERLWMWLFRASEFPWPEVQPRSWRRDYAEHALLGRNWRAGRCTVRRLAGHRDGINCLCVSGDLVVPPPSTALTRRPPMQRADDERGALRARPSITALHRAALQNGAFSARV